MLTPCPKGQESRPRINQVLLKLFSEARIDRVSRKMTLEMTSNLNELLALLIKYGRRISPEHALQLAMQSINLRRETVRWMVWHLAA